MNNPEELNGAQFDHFKAYARRMLNDLAGAKTGPYHNNPSMQEIAVSWNPDAEGPAIHGYPMPENVTHIVAEPYETVGMGDYAFKRLLQAVMEQAGFRQHTSPLISEIPAGAFECTMYHGGGMDFPLDPDYGSSSISMLFLRANGDLRPALETLAAVDDATLDRLCREVLKSVHRPVAGEPANGPGVAPPAGFQPG